jgi:hypothetical protein
MYLISLSSHNPRKKTKSRETSLFMVIVLKESYTFAREFENFLKDM